LNIVGYGLNKHQKKVHLILTVQTLIFWPRPFSHIARLAKNRNFAQEGRKDFAFK
jgi:hypothetical protein